MDQKHWWKLEESLQELESEMGRRRDMDKPYQEQPLWFESTSAPMLLPNFRAKYQEYEMKTPLPKPESANNSASSAAESVMEQQARKNPELAAKQARLIQKLKDSMSAEMVALDQVPGKR